MNFLLLINFLKSVDNMYIIILVFFIYWNVLRFDLDYKFYVVIIMLFEILELVFCLLFVYFFFLDLVIFFIFIIVIFWFL